MKTLETVENQIRRIRKPTKVSVNNLLLEPADYNPEERKKILVEKRRLVREQLKLMIKRSYPNANDLELSRCIPGRKLIVDGFQAGEIVDDRYRVMKLLDSGSMGNIYLVSDNENRNVYAMKTLVEAMHSEKAVRRFIREAKELSRLDHEYIINVLDFGISDGRPYYVMENLSDLFSSKPNTMDTMIKSFHEQKVSLNEMIRYFAQVAEALHFLHTRERTIVHRDLKPSNILINDSSTKLVDFGVSSVAGFTLTTLTDVNEIVGTPHYMPITDWDQNKVSPKSDLYSLGVMLYLLVTTELPFDFKKKSDVVNEQESTIEYVLSKKESDVCLIDTPFAKDTPGSGNSKKQDSILTLFNKIRNEEPKYDNILPGVDDRLIVLIKSLLSKNPDDRPLNARYVADELYAIEGSIKTPSIMQLIMQGTVN